MTESKLKRQIIIEKVTGYVMLALMIMVAIAGIVMLFQGDMLEPMGIARVAIVFPFAIWYTIRRFNKAKELEGELMRLPSSKEIIKQPDKQPEDDKGNNGGQGIKHILE